MQILCSVQHYFHNLDLKQSIEQFINKNGVIRSFLMV